MITVRLSKVYGSNPIGLAQHAANECYASHNPPFDENFESDINVEKVLWLPGHHTTLQHAAHYFTFQIEGIAVSEVTLGLHLTTPHYNTSQRSGRFCADMFTDLDLNAIVNYILAYWPGVAVEKIIDYIKLAHSLYIENLPQVKSLAADCIKQERPKAKQKYIATNAPKIAQEQLRMFIPTIFPTGLDYTVNLVTLAALYQTAWLPGMGLAVSQMVSRVLERYPELHFMFPQPNLKAVKRNSNELFFNIVRNRFNDGGGILSHPEVYLMDYRGKLNLPEPSEAHPVDLTTVAPWYMENNGCRVDSTVRISLATMGQDQRHRTISRTLPYFTGDFYIPPLLSCLMQHEKLFHLRSAWLGLRGAIPVSLFACLAPYGAMVSYGKYARGNAFLHETRKRLCWCTQEEICELNRRLREDLLTSRSVPDDDRAIIRQALRPPCAETGKCVEGRRYCGRDLSKIEEGYSGRRIV